LFLRLRVAHSESPRERMKMIRIPRSIYKEIVEHAEREWPLECCGILGGKEETVKKAFELSNVEKSSTRFLMSSREQLRVFEELEKESMEMIAIYHSHPHTISFPSETDVKMAYYPDVSSMIISLKEKDHPVVKAFRIEKKDILLVEIEVL
jgi:[CysO sulfur-carrier protein]-S-L-cysteine hydrolase